MAKKAQARNAANGKAHPKNATCQDGAYLLSLTIENVRCFKDKQTLDLSDGIGRPNQWTILLGNNGRGKTTILQLIALGSSRRLQLTQTKMKSRNEAPDFAASLMGNRYETLQFLRQDCDSFQCDLRHAHGPPLSTRNGVYTVEESRFGWRASKAIDSLSGSDAAAGFCCGYGASRNNSSASRTDGVKQTNNALDGSLGLFLEGAPLRNAHEWLLGLDYIARMNSDESEVAKARYQMVRRLLLEILPEVDDVRIRAGLSGFPETTVEFKTHHGWVGLRQLGYGYQTLIAWLVDFASRMVERYPDCENPLAQPAIVLVDEIDLHLHPSWQRGLIGRLTTHFPNTQFVATAHSPLVVQAAGADANIAVLQLDGDQVVIDQSVQAIRGWRIDQVLASDLFGVPARAPEIEKLLARRQAILTKPKLTDTDRKKVEELEEQIGELPFGETPDQRRLMETLESTLRLLEKKVGKPA
jgi:hypothetical protein